MLSVAAYWKEGRIRLLFLFHLQNFGQRIEDDIVIQLGEHHCHPNLDRTSIRYLDVAFSGAEIPPLTDTSKNNICGKKVSPYFLTKVSDRKKLALLCENLQCYPTPPRFRPLPC